MGYAYIAVDTGEFTINVPLWEHLEVSAKAKKDLLKLIKVGSSFYKGDQDTVQEIINAMKGWIQSHGFLGPSVKSIGDEIIGFNKGLDPLPRLLYCDKDLPLNIGFNQNNEHILYQLLNFPNVYGKLNRLVQFAVSIQHTNNSTLINSHDRLQHSFNAAIGGYMTAKKNNISDKDIKLLLASLLLHDWATPWGGDITKNAISGLSEEDNFTQYVNSKTNKNVKELLKKLDINIDKMQQIIKNKGMLGQCLDMIDKITYTLDDFRLNAQVYMNWIQASEGKKASKGMKSYDRVKILQTVTIEGNQVYFDCEPSILVDFRKIRAYMHKMIYLDPKFRTQEKFAGIVIKSMVKQGTVSIESLQHGRILKEGKISDERISEGIFATMKKNKLIPEDPTIIGESFLDYKATRVNSKKKEENKNEIEYLKEQYETLTDEQKKYAIIFEIPPFKPGLHFLIKHNGVIKPLSDALDETTRNKLIQLGQSTHRYVLCRTDERYLGPEFQAESYRPFREILEQEAQESQTNFFQAMK